METVVRLYNQGAYQEVLEYATEYVASDSTAIGVLECEVRAGILSDDCEQYVRDVLEADGDSYVHSFRRLMLLSLLGRYWEARVELDRIIQTYGQSGWTAYWEGELAYDAGQDAIAFERFQEAMVDSASRNPAMFSLYVWHADRGDLHSVDSVLQLLADIPWYRPWVLSRRAELTGMAGDWPGALAQFEQLASEYEDSRVYSRWAYVTSKLGYYDRAIQICRAALDKWPGSKVLQNRLMRAYQNVGMIDEALELSEDFQPLHLTYLWGSARMGEAFSLNDTLAIQTTARELIDVLSDYSYPVRRYLDWLDDRGRVREADSLEEMISRTCAPIVAARVKASRIDQDRPDDALRLVDSLLPGWKRTGSLTSRRIEWMLKAGRRTEAEALVDSLLTCTPGDIVLMLDMAQVEYHADRNEAAERWLARIDSLAPGSVDVVQIRAWLAHAADDRERALVYLDSLSHRYPSWSSLMWYYRDVLDTEDSAALAAVTERFRTYPGKNADHIEELALNYARLHRYDIADSLLAEALVRHSQAADLYFYRGIVHDWAGNGELADTYYRQAQSLDPSDEGYSRGTMASTLEAQPLLDYTGRQKVDSTALVLLSVDSVLSLAFSAADVKADYGGLQLLDKRQIIVRSEYRRLRRHHRVVKIVSDKGKKYYGTETLPFNAWQEMPCLVLARVIHPDGEVVDIKPSQVMVAGSANATTSDSRNVMWNYPQLDSGVVLEYIIQFQLRHAEAFDLSYIYLASDWDPMRRWSVELMTPDSWTINEHHTTGLDYRSYDSVGIRVHRWAADSLPVLVWENDCPVTWAQGEWLRFAYRKTWREEAERYWKRIATKFDTTGVVAELARSLTADMNDEEEVIAALFDYVAKKIRYEPVEFGSGSIIPRSAARVLQNKYGDCKDKTTLLLSLMRALGIEGYLALVSSYDTISFCRNVPTTSPFDHVLTYLPGEPGRYLDPTCAECEPYDLDIGYKSKPTLIVGSELDEPLLMTPPPTAEDQQYHRHTRMVVQDDGTLKLESAVGYVGQGALNWKSQYRTVDTAVLSNWIEQHSRVGFWVQTEFLDYELSGDEIGPGRRFGWTSRMQMDSLFVKGVSQVVVNLWFYSMNDFLSIPDTAGRTLDVIVGHRFHLTDHFTIVPGNQWELDNYRVSWAIDTTWFLASSQVTEWSDSISIAVEFTLKTPLIPVEELSSFVRAIDMVQKRVMNQRPLFRRAPDAERIALIEEALKQNPGDLSLIMSLPQLYLSEDLGGKRCQARERRDKVRSVLSQVIEQGTPNESVVMYLASLLMVDGQLLLADSLLKANEAENEPSTLLQVLAAANAFGLADYEDAEKRYRRLLEQVPDDEVRSQMARIQMWQDKFDEARAQIELLETLKADSSVFMGVQLEYYLALDSLEKVARLIELWPDTSKLVRASLKSLLYQHTGEYQKAYNDFAALLAEDPDNTLLLNNCAWFLAQTDTDLTAALEMIDKAMELTGHCDRSYINTRGLVLLQLGRVDEARLEFMTCLEEQTAESQTINNYFLGQCALAEDNQDMARVYFTRAVEANGDLLRLRAALEGLAKLDDTANQQGNGVK